MKTLIVEDDVTSALVLQGLLARYGECHIAVNGLEGVKAVRMALLTAKPYDFICLDIMMPEMDGQTALKEIRNSERELEASGRYRAKIVMTTAVADKGTVLKAIQDHCDGYLVKPIEKVKLLKELHRLGLLR